MTSRYLALTNHLTTQHEKTGRAEFELPFAEVSDIVGGLPDVATNRPQWWHNYKAEWLGAGWQMQHLSIAKKLATFVKAGNTTIRQEMEATNGKQRLRQFFEDLPQEQAQVVLTFEEYGRVRGWALSEKAQRSRPRWANTPGKAWMQAGWELQNIFMRSRLLLFRRAGTDITDNITQYLSHVLEGKPLKIPRPTGRDLIDWLRLCQRLGWNFEGVVLYEKGGIDLAVLDDVEQAELDQDYWRCKQRLPNPLGSRLGPAVPGKDAAA